MTVSGIINNDEIGITYDTVYTSKDVAETITVKIEDVKFDDSHEKNVCYEIKSYPSEVQVVQFLKNRLQVLL